MRPKELSKDHEIPNSRHEALHAFAKPHNVIPMQQRSFSVMDLVTIKKNLLKERIHFPIYTGLFLRCNCRVLLYAYSFCILGLHFSP